MKAQNDTYDELHGDIKSIKLIYDQFMSKMAKFNNNPSPFTDQAIPTASNPFSKKPRQAHANVQQSPPDESTRWFSFKRGRPTNQLSSNVDEAFDAMKELNNQKYQQFEQQATALRSKKKQLLLQGKRNNIINHARQPAPGTYLKYSVEPLEVVDILNEEGVPFDLTCALSIEGKPTFFLTEVPGNKVPSVLQVTCNTTPRTHHIGFQRARTTHSKA